MAAKEKEVLFEEILETWLEEIYQTHALSTYVKYTHHAKKYILPYVQSIPIKQITPGYMLQFFDDLKKGVPENQRIWDTYLEYLELAVANLRMAYDCDIILGGNIGGNMEGHMHMFQEKLSKYNNFDYDASYIHLGRHKRECSAIGAARLMQDRYIEKIETFSAS